MAQWRKVIVSGSNAELNNINSSGNVVPTITNGGSLGTNALNWSDLFLDSGAVVNFDSGDVTLTHSGNLLDIDGGNTRVDRLELDSASDYLDVSTDLQIVAAADVSINAGGGNVKPSANDGSALGVSGTAFSDLFLASGAVVDFNAGDVTLTHSANALTVGGGDVLIGGNSVSGSSASTGSFGHLNVSGNGVFGGNLTFGDANTDSVSFGADIDSNLIPNADDTYDLGSATQAWQDLFIEGDITLTDAGSVKATAGNLTVDSEAATLVLDGHTGVDIDASNSGKVAIDGAGGIDIGVAADVAIDIDSAALDIDASGAITIDGTSTLSIDAADDMNFTITSGTGGEDLTIAQVGANDSSIIITAAGTGADAVSIDATAGSMVIGATLVDTKTLTLGNTLSTYLQLTPHGTAASEKVLLYNASGSADDAIKIHSDAGGVTIKADNDSLHIDADGTDADALNIDSAGGIDVDAAAAVDILAASTLTAKGATGASLGDDTGTWEFDGAGALSETGMTTVSITPSSTFDLDAAGAITIDGASITLGGDSDTAFDIDTSTLDIDSSGAITIDSTEGVSVQGGAASDFTTGVGALTLDGAGGVNIAGNAAEVDVTTSGAVDINSGAFTLNGSTVGIDGSAALTLGASEMDIDADGGVINMDATSTITIGGTNATGVTIGKSDTTVSIPGSLDVNGTLTTIDTTNLKVADRFILMASGSSSGDGGIVVETDGAGAGTSLGYDDSASRWALSKADDTSHSSTTITPRQYVVSVSGSAADASGNPSDFGSAAGDRIGMMHVNTSTGDIFIFS